MINYKSIKKQQFHFKQQITLHGFNFGKEACIKIYFLNEVDLNYLTDKFEGKTVLNSYKTLDCKREFSNTFKLKIRCLLGLF